MRLFPLPARPRPKTKQTTTDLVIYLPLLLSTCPRVSERLPCRVCNSAPSRRLCQPGWCDPFSSDLFFWRVPRHNRDMHTHGQSADLSFLTPARFLPIGLGRHTHRTCRPGRPLGAEPEIDIPDQSKFTCSCLPSDDEVYFWKLEKAHTPRDRARGARLALGRR